MVTRGYVVIVPVLTEIMDGFKGIQSAGSKVAACGNATNATK